MTTQPTGPECPECGSRYKHLPPGRQGQYHVYCDHCEYDFGRYDHFVAQFRHLLDDLETHLKHKDDA